MATAEFTMIASDLLTIEPTVYQCWLAGLTVEQTAAREQRHHPHLPPYLHAKRVASQYMELELVEQALHRPRSFVEGWLFQAPPGVKRRLIHGYYRLDEPVVRELLGRKITSRLRRDLEQVATKHRIPLVSCRRQFDNLRRIFKQMEDLQGQSLQEEIESRFLLPRELANRYAILIFACHHRLDMNKRKLQRYRVPDFEYCCQAMLARWTVRAATNRDHISQHSEQAYSNDTTCETLEEFDDQLVHVLRELRQRLVFDRDRLDRLRSLMSPQDAGSSDTTHPTTATSGVGLITSPQLANDFKSLIRNIFNIGISLSNAKEVRGLFSAMLEKIVEPCAALGWSPTELETFFTVLLDAVTRLFSQEMDEENVMRYIPAFERWIEGLRLCCARLHRGLVVAQVSGS